MTLFLQNLKSQTPSLYFHIPYCERLCTYCDFAKTANYQDSHLRDYFSVLSLHTSNWLKKLSIANKVPSVYFGGGTPSLLTKEYHQLFNSINSLIAADAEVTLECNPKHINTASMNSWKDAGINRISLGIQSFNNRILKVLGRDHDKLQAQLSIKAVSDMFRNYSMDLIYGTPNQTMDEFKSDLNCIIELRPPHLSAYILTYANKTILGRQYNRGKCDPLHDDTIVAMYEILRETLQENGYVHNEVSNWSLPEFNPVHNSRYWKGKPYLGIGTGAHGYLKQKDTPYGIRYHYSPNDRILIKEGPTLDDAVSKGLIDWEHERNAMQWLMEYISSIIRTRYGVSIPLITKTTGMFFVPTKLISDKLQSKSQDITITEDKIIELHPKEWIRETRWALELIECFKL